MFFVYKIETFYFGLYELRYNHLTFHTPRNPMSMDIQAQHCKYLNRIGNNETMSCDDLCSSIIFFGVPLCHFHTKKVFLIHTILIQRAYRCHKIRQTINRYKNLPHDVWRMVLFRMNEDQLIEKHHHAVIVKIIKNKLIDLYSYKLFEITAEFKIRGIMCESYVKDMINLLRLFEKYYTIIPWSVQSELVCEIYNCENSILDGDEDLIIRAAQVHPSQDSLDLRSSLIKSLHNYIQFICHTNYGKVFRNYSPLQLLRILHTA